MQGLMGFFFYILIESPFWGENLQPSPIKICNYYITKLKDIHHDFGILDYFLFFELQQGTGIPHTILNIPLQ